MRAMAYDAYGSDDVLTLRELPDPKVGPGEVRIRVRRAGVNPVDWKVMAGGLDGLMDVVFPVVPGWDVAGTVESVGIDTPEFEVGDEVVAYARKDVVHGGTFAELVTMSVRGVAHKSAALSWDEAGGLPLAGLIALQTLDRLVVSASDAVLVHGGAGGVGTLAVPIARAPGARMIATASTSSLTSWAGSAKSRWRCWPSVDGTPPSPTRRCWRPEARGSGRGPRPRDWPSSVGWPTPGSCACPSPTSCRSRSYPLHSRAAAKLTCGASWSSPSRTEAVDPRITSRPV